MKKVLPLLLIFVYSFAAAQNYECVHRGKTTFFTNNTGYLRGIRFDSVVVSGADTIFYPYKTKRYFAASSDSSNGSWVGSKIIQQPNGTFLFNTFFKDTVVIKTQANLGESWVFYNDHTPDRYIATVESIGLRTFNGITDTVKTINIRGFNDTGFNYLDGRKLLKFKISKNHGFVSIFNLYMFPYYKPHNPLRSGDYWFDIYMHDLLIDYIAPIHAPNNESIIFNISDFHSPTEIELYDFQINDVFFKSEYISRNSTGVGRISISLDSIIDIVNISPYKKQYKLRCSSATKSIAPGTTPEYVAYSNHINVLEYDTSRIMNIKGVPEELYNWDTSYYYFPEDTTLCYKSPMYMVKQMPMFEICDYFYYYKKGYGEFQSENFTPPTSLLLEIGCGEVISYGIAYSVKSGIKCGNYSWLYPSSISNIQPEQSTITISPNPASNIINISSSDVIHTLSVSDYMGRVIIHTTYNSNNVTLPIDMLSSGMYILKINNTIARKIEVIK